MRFDDISAIRFVTRIVAVHAASCLFAVLLVITAPFSIKNFIEETAIPKRLIEEGKVIEAPILKEAEIGFSQSLNKHWFHIGYRDGAVRVYSDRDPADLDSVKVFAHPLIGEPGYDPRAGSYVAKVVLVPEPADDWGAVYESYHGRGFGSALWRFCLLIAATIILPIIAIGGYFAIKGKRPRPRKKRRRRSR